MSATAQLLLRDYAGHQWPTLNHKGRIARLAGHLRMGHRRVRALYQNEFGVRVRADEMAAIEALRHIEEAKNEHRELAQLAASLQALLFGPEADFYRPQVDAIRAALVPQGGSFARGSAEPGSGDQGRSAASNRDDDPV